MRLSTILLPFVVTLAALVAASPVAEVAEFGLVKVSGHPSNIESIVGGPTPNVNGGEDELGGGSGETTGVSKREDFNPLEERSSVTIALCSKKNCKSCWGYNLSAAKFNVCYSSKAFKSVYIPHHGGLGYGAYIGSTCKAVTLIPRTETCYNILHGKTGHKWGKKH